MTHSGHRRRKIWAFLFIVPTLALFACSAGRGSLADREQAVETAFNEAVALYEQRAFREALEAFTLLTDPVPDSPTERQAFFYIGLSFYRLGEHDEARNAFRTVIESGGDEALLNRAAYYTALCDHRQEAYSSALKGFQQVLSAEADPSLHGSSCYYIGEIHALLGERGEALEWYLLSLESTAEAKRNSVETRIERLIGEEMSLYDLEEADMRYTEVYPSDLIRCRLGHRSLETGDLESARAILDELDGRESPDARLAGEIEALRDAIDRELGVAPDVIGCILPLSGKYAPFGRKALLGLQLGADVFNLSEAEAVTLVVMDSAGDPEQAVNAVEAFYDEEKVIGIVGPLLSWTTAEASRRAQELGIPLLTLTQREGGPAAGDYIFQNAVTDSRQVRALVEYATEILEVSTFGVLYPDDPYGSNLTQKFVEEVFRTGGELMAAVRYPPGRTDFAAEIRALTGEHFWTKMLEEEAEEEEGEPVDGTGEETGEETVVEGETGGVVAPEEDPAALAGDEGDLLPEEEVLEEETLQDLLPFEALFLPDTYQTIALIAPQLTFYEVTGLPLLGTNSWNSPNLASLAGDYLQEAIFVDGFFLESTQPEVNEFLERFRLEFQREPGLIEALAYDSIRMMIDRLRFTGAVTRRGLRDGLDAVEAYPGASGTTSFDSGGEAEKSFFLLTVQNRRIVQIY